MLLTRRCCAGRRCAGCRGDTCGGKFHKFCCCFGGGLSGSDFRYHIILDFRHNDSLCRSCDCPRCRHCWDRRRSWMKMMFSSSVIILLGLSWKTRFINIIIFLINIRQYLYIFNTESQIDGKSIQLNKKMCSTKLISN